MPTDRNRGPGRVPGSPWNLSIRPTRSPPPAYRLTASHFSPPFLFAVLSTSVPSPIHLLLRFFTEFQVLFSLFSTNISSTSSPILLFHLFISTLFFFYISVFLFLFFFFVAIYRFHFAHLPKIFFFFTCRRSFFRFRKKITEILRSPLSILIQTFVLAATPRENLAFFNEIPCRECR